FGQNDLEIETKDQTLVVTGRQPESNEEKTYLHHGIAARAFKRSFQIADHVKVSGARLENGLLHIDLVREIPDAMKPRQIQIETAQPKSISADPKKVSEEKKAA
ncbi:MAG: Hsp20 family protein, partial [Kiloniellales bacterium]|nr:Hsp20 family protein [Kiloniellales bacterium]